MLTMSLISLAIWLLCLSLAVFGLLSSLKSETELADTMASLMTLTLTGIAATGMLVTGF